MNATADLREAEAEQGDQSGTNDVRDHRSGAENRSDDRGKHEDPGSNDRVYDVRGERAHTERAHERWFVWGSGGISDREAQACAKV